MALSFFAKDMLLLRAISVLASCVGMAYNYFIPVGPIWIPIVWNIFFIISNSYRIIGIFLDRRTIKFNEEELELSETLFKNFSPLEFMKLMRISEWKSVQKGFKFAKQHEEMDGLFLLFNGEVCIKKDGLEVGVIRDGSMIGEISFIRGGEATATVLATNVCRVIHWYSIELKNILIRNPSMDIGMKHVFSMDLTRKLIDA